MALKVGTPAPDFVLESDKGGSVKLAEHKGKHVVLFFYPKDDTPGCTKESCEFRDQSEDFAKKNTVVYGISADNTRSHQAFSSKYNLNFPLLSDTTTQVCQNYGVWSKQSWGGREDMGISRTTFIINEKGMIEKIYNNVNPVGHAAQVLADLP